MSLSLSAFFLCQISPVSFTRCAYYGLNNWIEYLDWWKTSAAMWFSSQVESEYHVRIMCNCESKSWMMKWVYMMTASTELYLVVVDVDFCTHFEAFDTYSSKLCEKVTREFTTSSVARVVWRIAACNVAMHLNHCQFQ